MPYYAAPGTLATVTSAYKSTVAAWLPAIAAGVRRFKVYEIMVGANGTPNTTDCAIQCDVSRISATGTAAGGSYIPNSLDPQDPSCTTTGLFAVTTEPTMTATSALWGIGMNQRATVRWIAAQESQYMLSFLSSGTGLALRALSSNFGNSFDGQMTYME